MATKPATGLFNSINAQIKQADTVDPTSRVISVRTLQRWRKLAQSIDARMRLDGSKKNRRRAK